MTREEAGAKLPNAGPDRFENGGTEVLRERIGSVGRITINRPDNGNMLNMAVRQGLFEAFRALSVDRSIQVVILTGAGDTFSLCSDGKDVRQFLSAGEPFHNYHYMLRDLHNLMKTVPQPIIAALNGTATMGGLELALSCDLMVAADTALIGDCHPAGMGGGGLSQRLPPIIGSRATRWLLYTDHLYSAQEALNIGLVQQVYPHSAFQDAVLALANSMIEQSMGDSLARIKRLTAWTDEPSQAALHAEITACVEHYTNPAVQQELAQWLSKAQLPE